MIRLITSIAPHLAIPGGRSVRSACTLCAVLRPCQCVTAPLQAVLGLATGSTPTSVYRELVALHKAQGLSWAHVVTFNLDEYWPMAADAWQSYHRWALAGS
jgi:hypothetical protein